jgi:hypothetical protein
MFTPQSTQSGTRPLTQGYPAASGAYPNYNNNPLMPQQIISTRMLETFMRPSILHLISDTSPIDELKPGNKGTVIRFRKAPTGIKSRPLNKNGTIISDVISFDSCAFSFGSMNVMSLKVDATDNYTVPGMAQYIAEAWAQALQNEAYAKDCEGLAMITQEADCNNRGATAGATSHDINLGTPTAPFALTSANALQFLIQLVRVFTQQGINGSALGTPYVLIPPDLRFLLATSLTAMNQMAYMGSSSLMDLAFSDVSVLTPLGSGLAVIPTAALGSTRMVGVAGGVPVYKILFGYAGATAHGTIIDPVGSRIEGTHDSLGIFERRWSMHGTGVIYKNAVGVAYVTIPPLV